MNLDSLEAIAKKATPGPRLCLHGGEKGPRVCLTNSGKKTYDGYLMHEDHPLEPNDEALMLAMNPQIALALVAVAKAAKEFLISSDNVGFCDDPVCAGDHRDAFDVDRKTFIDALAALEATMKET